LNNLSKGKVAETFYETKMSSEEVNFEDIIYPSGIRRDVVQFLCRIEVYRSFF
jgi:hypothetical protein